jgi:hypothetical protein
MESRQRDAEWFCRISLFEEILGGAQCEWVEPPCAMTCQSTAEGALRCTQHLREHTGSTLVPSSVLAFGVVSQRLCCLVGAGGVCWVHA